MLNFIIAIIAVGCFANGAQSHPVGLERAGSRLSLVLPERVAPMEETPVTPLEFRQRTATEQRSDSEGKAVIHVLYVLPSDAVDQRRDVNGVINNAVTAGAKWFLGQTGNLALRFDRITGVLDVTFVRLDETDAALAAHDGNLRDYLEIKLAGLGFNRLNKIYLAFYEGINTGTCGDSYVPDFNDNHGGLSAMYLNGLLNLPEYDVSLGWLIMRPFFLPRQAPYFHLREPSRSSWG